MSKLKIGSLFSGYGGLDKAVVAVTGGEVVWHCEFADGPSKILQKNHPNIPNHKDIRQVDFSKVEPIDILTGGFPCQDLSHAGSRLGIKEGTRSGLWIEFARAIEELKPRMVVIENVRGLLSGKAHSDVELGDQFVVQRKSDPALRAMGGVLGDLADLGYDARWQAFAPLMLGAATNDSEYSLLPTPAPGHYRNNDEPVENYLERVAKYNRGEYKGKPGISLGVALRLELLPTPLTRDHKEGTVPHLRDGVVQTDNVPRAVFNSGEVEKTEQGYHYGKYEAAVRHWETIMGRKAPEPISNDGKNGGSRLAAPFVEWMMGLEEGTVCGNGLSRREELTLLGNGVVPQQAELALRVLLQNTKGTILEEVLRPKGEHDEQL